MVQVRDSGGRCALQLVCVCCVASRERRYWLSGGSKERWVLTCPYPLLVCMLWRHQRVARGVGQSAPWSPVRYKRQAPAAVGSEGPVVGWRPQRQQMLPQIIWWTTLMILDGQCRRHNVPGQPAGPLYRPRPQAIWAVGISMGEGPSCAEAPAWASLYMSHTSPSTQGLRAILNQTVKPESATSIRHA